MTVAVAVALAVAVADAVHVGVSVGPHPPPHGKTSIDVFSHVTPRIGLKPESNRFGAVMFTEKLISLASHDEVAT